MVFVIKSAVGNFERRRAIRRTWGRVRVFDEAMFEYIFLVGKPPRNEAAAVEDENIAYGDILQMNELDSAG